MCTHLHADHVGWNTRLAGGRWVPTFPNARYLFARTEYEHRIALNRRGKKHSVGCTDRAQSAATRRAFLERHADTGTLVMPAHFPSPSVGFVRARGEAFDWVYDE